MQNPSRRAFLGGRTPEISAWDQFLLQLQRKTQGELRVLGKNQEQAVLVASVIADLHFTRQLCHAFGVKLLLWGIDVDIVDEEPVLWLDMSALDQLAPVNDSSHQWFMQAGTRIEQLKAVGFDELKNLPDDLQVGQWLADSSYHSYALVDIMQSGVLHASLLMADGSVSSLGPFGTTNTKPLNTAQLRQIVPQLFQLVNSQAAVDLAQLAHCPGSYRWDIFQARNPNLNLAHLLLGHAGHLGIVEWVVLDKKALALAAPKPEVSLDGHLLLQAQELDAAVKQLFDPEFLFSV